MMIKRVFLIVLDSFGIGEMPDAADYGDAGSNTLGSISASSAFDTPNLRSLGLFHIDGTAPGQDRSRPGGAYARMAERSKGKDTTIGHWEIAGILSEKPLPTYPEGFPAEVIEEFSRRTGRAVLCNKPYSGTQLLLDYGREHMETGALIVYTSADSVFQIAAHEEIVPVPELYRYCEIARELLQGKHGVGRVIARPFRGSWPDFVRTANRHDYSLTPPAPTMLDALRAAGLDTIGVGKIYDIFAGRGIGETYKTANNDDGMAKTLELAEKDFHGLAFVNLVDFDMVYGHRNNVEGYAGAATRFDRQLGELLPRLRGDDVLIITADHGCDPATPSTDHSREYTPMLAFGAGVQPGCNLGTRGSFSDIGATVLDMLGVKGEIAGESFWPQIRR
ncbi:MAG: phosphopentomutase [Oscillospiraceae bacterium]|nr:phosphopentomutase [Oscillospiraceae bacterium]